MTNVQLYFAIGLPCLTVMASLIISLLQISGIRQDMREALKEIREDIREIRSDLKYINGKLSEMDVELGKLMDRMK